MSMPELVEAMNMPRSTITRVLNTLMMYGLVEKQDRNYCCGRLFDDWAQRDRHLILKRRYRPLLEELSRRTGELSLLGLHEGNGVVHIDYVESDQRIRVAPAPGTRHPLQVTAMGKLALARRPDLAKQFESPALQEELEEIRRTGVAWNREESVSGMVAMATYGFSDGITEPMLVVSWPVYRFTVEKAQEALSMIEELRAKYSE